MLAESQGVGSQDPHLQNIVSPAVKHVQAGAPDAAALTVPAVAQYTVGATDVMSQFRVSQKLYGRQEQVHTTRTGCDPLVRFAHKITLLTCMRFACSLKRTERAQYALRVPNYSTKHAGREFSGDRDILCGCFLLIYGKIRPVDLAHFRVFRG